MSSSATGSPDRLIIRNLELQCVIGAQDWEHLMPQRVVVDIELKGDFSAAADSDDLADAVDYREVCARAIEVAEEAGYRLLETLTDRIARAALDTHECITSATVSVFKPLALAGFGTANATVEVMRDSGSHSQDS